MSSKPPHPKAFSHSAISRRSFVSSLASMAACSQVPSKDTGDATETCEATTGLQTLTDGSHLTAPVFESNPFQLGVASGAPLPDRVILWTRLVIDPRADDGLGGITESEVPVQWEIATDENFDTIINQGIVATREDLAHAVHIDADGLEAETEYYYRFRVGEWVSDTGRTLTTPCPGASHKPSFYHHNLSKIRRRPLHSIGRYSIRQTGHLVHAGITFMNTARKQSSEPNPTRLLSTSQATENAMHYKSDENLKAAHATCPFEPIWDDHEVKNNYAGDNASDEFRQRMAIAYKAFYEHMPLRLHPPTDDSLKIYRRLQWGDLAQFILLDTRQYRSQPACNPEEDPNCPLIEDTSQYATKNKRHGL